MLLPAILLVAATLASDTPELHRPPEPIPMQLEEIQGLPVPAPLPDELPVRYAESRIRVAGYYDGNTIVVEVLGRDRVRLGRLILNLSELIRRLGSLADGSRNEGSLNRVSNRKLVLRAEPQTHWRAVREVLLAATGPAVRIHRISLAEPGRKPVPITLLPEWLPDPDGNRIELEPVATLTVEVKRRPDEGESHIKLLDSDLGAGEEAFLDLEHKAARIRAVEGNRSVPAEVTAWAIVPVAEVLRSMRLLWSLGYPRVRLLCLMPEPPLPDIPEPTTWIDYRAGAERLAGRERTDFLLAALWKSGRIGNGAIPDLLREDGVRSTRAILARLAEVGPPNGDRGLLEQTEIGLISPTGFLLYTFGEAAIPDLLTATASSSPLVRIKAIEALGGYRSATPEVREAMHRMMELDPDPKARQTAKDALTAVHPRPPLQDPD